MAKKDIVIKRYDENTIELIRDKKNITIYVWKDAVKPYHETEEFIKLITSNNINVIYFEDRENYMNKTRWVIKDEDDNYWTGKYATHPINGCQARLFLQYKSYAKKYFSKKVAERAAKTMEENGVFDRFTYIDGKDVKSIIKYEIVEY